jgi:hypothetical protein
MANNVGSDAYGKFQDFNQLSYNCISYLMNNNEMIWKLLKYDTSDAWDKTNLTSAEKAALIYNGQEDGSTYKVFMDSGIPDVWTTQGSIIRISPCNAFAKNRTVGIMAMCFEAYSHYRINTLSNYTTRVDTMIQQFIDVFNGTIELGGIGRLFFDALRDQEDKLSEGGKIPFKGKRIYMSVNTG